MKLKDKGTDMSFDEAMKALEQLKCRSNCSEEG